MERSQSVVRQRSLLRHYFRLVSLQYWYPRSSLLWPVDQLVESWGRFKATRSLPNTTRAISYLLVLIWTRICLMYVRNRCFKNHPAVVLPPNKTKLTDLKVIKCWQDFVVSLIGWNLFQIQEANDLSVIMTFDSHLSYEDHFPLGFAHLA